MTREHAKLMYRALRSAGPTGLSRLEMEEMFRWDARTVLSTVLWLRTHGVDVRLAPDPVVLSWERKGRFVLGELLPAAWDATV